MYRGCIWTHTAEKPVTKMTDLAGDVSMLLVIVSILHCIISIVF